MRWRDVLVGVAVGGLLVAAVPVVAGTGDPIVNGEMNWARRTTVVRTSGQETLRLQSNRGSPLDLRAAFGHAPLIVDSDVKVVHLNADELDGLDSLAFMQSAYYDADANAIVDSIPVTGWSGGGDYGGGEPPSGVFTSEGNPVTVAADGSIYLTGSADLLAGASAVDPYCYFEVQLGAGADFVKVGLSDRDMELAAGGKGICATDAVVGVTAGTTVNVRFWIVAAGTYHLGQFAWWGLAAPV